MKVILKKELSNLGRFGDVVKVAEGYARNYLLPRGFAVRANESNLRQLAVEREAFQKKSQRLKEKAGKIKAGLDIMSLSFSRKAGEDEKLFGSVTAHDIETELKAKGFEVDKKEILLEEPIKSLGVFPVKIKLHPEVLAEIKVWVVKE